VEFLVRRIETGARMEIVLYDVSAEELAADLAATDSLEQTGIHGMLVEQSRMDAHQGPLSAVIGLYGFDLLPPHAELLGRIAWIAAAAGAPFVAGMAPQPLLTPMHEQAPFIRDAFGALWQLPECAYLGLAAPRFLLRLPYGKRTDPIDAFAFEEFTLQGGLGGMLWGHPALIPALLLAESYLQQGAKMKLGTVMGVDDIPYYVFNDTDGEQIALPCTERLFTERMAGQVGQYRVMPLLSIRGRPEVRLGSFASVAGAPLAGLWAPIQIAPRPALQETPAAQASAPPAEAEPDLEPEATPEPVGAATEAVREEETAEPAPEEAAAETPDAGGADAPADDLDALLASLNEPAPEVAADETEPDLDALLASLK
jgi:type VI secretion system protein ImpC